MPLISWLSGLASGPRITRHARELSRQLHGAIWQTVVARLRGMSLAEARGYARARAGLLIEQEVNRLIGQSPSLALHRDRLVAITIDESARLVVNDMLKAGCPAFAIRRAA